MLPALTCRYHTGRSATAYVHDGILFILQKKKSGPCGRFLDPFWSRYCASNCPTSCAMMACTALVGWMPSQNR